MGPVLRGYLKSRSRTRVENRDGSPYLLNPY